ncbi:aminotransferase class I/II-fold pyridoxal phosphate-dependent enzyme [Dyadobacter sp. CY312]|uniref:aminotransferase class I/II-fold pyridoxal phosphate-dependent enzyme n=1 Tax=Dyadobacter sp. CY312 TaxID=2907303 RepID=UPI001F2CFC29|nr:aminotransferase class I/II-fold pyridoxal phosphate-dependent enzyme [Dyadobacter sp. CY312]MCE7043077.1 aminotransferase class I/II-fold pyridoxal phosphate-dependent enzyme [Dyadobacter sp. CY312]
MKSYIAKNLPGRTVKLENGEEYLWFSGTDYLGMGHNENFRRFLTQGISEFGTHFGSSRNNSLQLNIYTEAEKELAAFGKAPAAVTLSSGMWAGQILMKEIENIITSTNAGYENIHYHYAPSVHPAIRGNHYSACSTSWADWAAKTLTDISNASDSVVHIICTDSVGSPWVQNFDFSVFNNLSDPKVWLIVDDSHGIGATGEYGGGIYAQLQHLQKTNVVVCASLNKGMGIPAGVIFADTSVIDYLKTTPWYSGASPCAPAYIFALKQLLLSQTYQRNYLLLKENIRYFQDQTLANSIFTSIESYPVFCSKNPLMFDYLLNNRIMTSHFPYPSPIDEPVMRLAISAIHTKKDLDRLAEVCIQFNQENLS